MLPIRFRKFRVQGIDNTGKVSDQADAVVLIVVIDPQCPLGPTYAKEGPRQMVFGDIDVLVRSHALRRAGDVIRNTCLSGKLDEGQRLVGIFHQVGWVVMHDGSIDATQVPFLELGNGAPKVTTRLDGNAIGTLLHHGQILQQDLGRILDALYAESKKVPCTGDAAIDAGRNAYREVLKTQPRLFEDGEFLWHGEWPHERTEPRAPQPDDTVEFRVSALRRAEGEADAQAAAGETTDSDTSQS